MPRYPALDLTFAPGPGAGTLQDMLYAELDAFEPVAIHEHESGDGWRVFFRTGSARDSAHGALASEFGNALLRLVAVNVDDEDWARRSQASLTAVRVGRIVVAPPWAVNQSSQITHLESMDPGPRTTDPDAITIVIDPSMGFGTGHHATTRVCLQLLQRADVSGARVIDVGTGSGVLAIAAWKLGASSVTAMDNDPDALSNARENLALNGAADAIEIVEVDISSASVEPGDLVLANLTAAVLQRHAHALRRLAGPDAALIVSGFSRDELDDVAAALAANVVASVEEGDWVAARFQITRQP